MHDAKAMVITLLSLDRAKIVSSAKEKAIEQRIVLRNTMEDLRVPKSV